MPVKEAAARESETQLRTNPVTGQKSLSLMGYYFDMTEPDEAVKHIDMTITTPQGETVLWAGSRRFSQGQQQDAYPIIQAAIRSHKETGEWGNTGWRPTPSTSAKRG